MVSECTLQSNMKFGPLEIRPRKSALVDGQGNFLESLFKRRNKVDGLLENAFAILK